MKLYEYEKLYEKRVVHKRKIISSYQAPTHLVFRGKHWVPIPSVMIICCYCYMLT